MKLKELYETVRGLVHMVLDGDLPGLFVVGPGGLGKSRETFFRRQRELRETKGTNGNSPAGEGNRPAIASPGATFPR